MSLFDFLKPKKNVADTIFDAMPSMQFARLELELDTTLKQASNLTNVGRRNDATKIFAKYIIEDYLKTAPGRVATSVQLAQLAYRLTYRFLPFFISESWNEFAGIWRSGVPSGTYFGLLGSVREALRLSYDQIFAFAHQSGELVEGVDYYLIQFPSPPPRTKEKPFDLDTYRATPESERSVLAPYFATALENRKAQVRQLFVLGQSPGGGTALRAVTREKGGGYANGNQGPGCEPTAAEFVALLRKRVGAGTLFGS